MSNINILHNVIYWCSIEPLIQISEEDFLSIEVGVTLPLHGTANTCI